MLDPLASLWLGDQPDRYGRGSEYGGTRGIVAASGNIQHGYVDQSGGVDSIDEDLQEADDRNLPARQWHIAVVDGDGNDGIAGGNGVTVVYHARVNQGIAESGLDLKWEVDGRI